MKKLLVSGFALLVCVVGYSQNAKSFYNSSYESRNSGSFSRSASLLTFGLGFPNTSVNVISGFPPIYAKYEHGFLRDEVGLGGYIASGFGTIANNNFAAFSFGILGYYHFNKLIPISKMDVYAGAGGGFRSVSFDKTTIDRNRSDALLIVRVGIRYFLKPKLAVYAETGFDGMSTINLGVTLKLR
jgi:hypothetical protein